MQVPKENVEELVNLDVKDQGVQRAPVDLMDLLGQQVKQVVLENRDPEDLLDKEDLQVCKIIIVA